MTAHSGAGGRAQRLVPAARTVAGAQAPVKPLLKWAGGKRQLLPHLRRFYPAAFVRYWEPFAGSAAVFLDLWNGGQLTDRVATLADTNADLIACYTAVRDRPDDVIEILADLSDRHRARPRQTFYEVRRRFNEARVLGRRDAGTAAMLVYLNRTGYNGLFRLNARGAFNVPLGRYDAPRICDPAHIRQFSAILSRPNVRLRLASYERILGEAEAGDFVYLDPPYAPLTATSNFRSYTAEGFSPRDQQRLQALAIELARRGCAVLLSNSTAPEIAHLYEQNADASRAGLTAFRVGARRAINSRASGRGPVEEFLVTTGHRTAP